MGRQEDGSRKVSWLAFPAGWSPAVLVLAAASLAACGKDAPAAAGTPAAGAPPADQPIRLLLITLDTLRADRLGTYGYRRPTSPALDALARSATVFEDVTCSIPTTLPSHLTIFTGLTPAQHGVTENGQVPAGDLTSIFDLLAGRGARTAGVISAKVLHEKFLVGLGLSEVSFGDGSAAKSYEVPAGAVTDRAIDWLSDHGGEPFVLWLHYYDPHEPYLPPAAFAERFAGGYRGALSAPADEWAPAVHEKGFDTGLSDRDRRYVSDLYDAEVAALDAELGRLFAFLQARGLWRQTLVLAVGDHGQALGENRFWGHGEQLLEPVVRVPLVVKLPGQKRAARMRTPVETLDLMPTLAAFYGLAVPPGLGGRSLLDALRSGAEPPSVAPRIIERRSYSRTAPERLGLALHGGDWKLSFYRESDGSRYHLGRGGGAGGLDGENFFTPGVPELRLLRQVLARHKQPAAARSPFSEETLKMLRALGYAD